ncbi:carbohydrate kinase family protein [Candidatus Woesearchaeota archaeon]|nr:carbohydrate kinase family protein [Candidatus Woesearchaeota archaeon]
MYDIITVGGATEDVFIKTKNPEIIKKNKLKEVCYPVGTKILVDEIFFDTGGGGTNSAVAFSRLGIKTGYLGKLGTDPSARNILEQLKKEKVGFIGKRKNGMTGYSVILIGIEKDRTILTYKGAVDDLKKGDVDFNKLKKAKWLYISSMIGESFKTAEKIAEFARKNKIHYTFNPSTYLAKLGIKKLKNFINGCDLLILNREEAGLLAGKNKKTDELLKELQKHAKVVVITEGKKGASAYNGIEKYIVIPRNIKVVETTGAGAAFASGFTAGIVMGESLEDSLRIGQFESESVIVRIGAKNNLLTKSEIVKMLKTKHVRILKKRL